MLSTSQYQSSPRMLAHLTQFLKTSLRLMLPQRLNCSWKTCHDFSLDGRHCGTNRSRSAKSLRAPVTDRSHQPPPRPMASACHWPEPLGPTTASARLDGTVRLSSLKIGKSGRDGYTNVMSRNSMSPPSGSDGITPPIKHQLTSYASFIAATSDNFPTAHGSIYLVITRHWNFR